MTFLFFFACIVALCVMAAMVVMMCIYLADAAYYGDLSNLLRGVVAGVLAVCAGLFAFMCYGGLIEAEDEQRTEWREEQRLKCEESEGLVMETTDGEYYGCISNPDELLDALESLELD